MYPKTKFLGISAFSYEYASVFKTILGVFVFFLVEYLWILKKKNTIISEMN